MQEWQRRWVRAIPPVNAVLETPPVREMLARHSRQLVLAAVQAVLAEVREAIRGSAREEDLAGLSLAARDLGERAAAWLRRRLAPRLRRVINATGVVLHTNMGRAPLAPAAVAAIAEVASRYNNLELDLATGERGSRQAHVEDLICQLTGAEAAMVVNNNAAAVLLMLSALCRDREVVISRGELVEIGGSFRVPEVMVQGGARLVEVGTTNKTHLRDYERAIGPNTGAILKVHSSNFKIIGFTAAPTVAELADLAHRHGLPLLVDWGSGVMIDLARLGIEREMTMPELIAAGADLITFSGDKLLGGPQGGFIVGRRELVAACRSHPLARAVRIDKLTLAGIEATLRLYLDPERALAEIPTLAMLGRTREALRPAAQELAERVAAAVGDRAEVQVVEGTSQAGGGALPGVEIPTVLVAVTPRLPVHRVEARLREADPPVIVRVQQDRILLDLRTLWPEEFPLVAGALAQACKEEESDDAG
ncbi:MAG: L-seryl-tRNA(Sec) selenium transferase [Firmicutes bacterium]|nr:L-seryl-tRNA(Sec) selenium transferase [Bacillota bacterium]